MLAMRPQKSAGSLTMTSGPGWTPCTISAPSSSAMMPLAGSPSVSSGMNDVCAAALLADSGPATPAMAPVPSGGPLEDTFFSMCV